MGLVFFNVRLRRQYPRQASDPGRQRFTGLIGQAGQVLRQQARQAGSVRSNVALGFFDGVGIDAERELVGGHGEPRDTYKLIINIRILMGLAKPVEALDSTRKRPGLLRSLHIASGHFYQFTFCHSGTCPQRGKAGIQLNQATGYRVKPGMTNL